jgi:YaiO family outer membrane protein
MHGRVFLWMKRYDEAYITLKKAYNKSRSASLLAEAEKAQALSRLVTAEKLLTEGQAAEGEALLNKLYKQGIVRYEAGMLLARSTFDRSAFSEAATILAELLVRYPKEKDQRPRYAQSLMNTGREWQALVYIDTLPERELDAELLAINARILFRTGFLDGAIWSFKASLAHRPDKDVAAELGKAEIAQKLKKADAFFAAGDDLNADALLAPLCDMVEARYEGCRRRAAVLSRVGNHERAAVLYAQLAASYPVEPDFKLQHAQELVHLQKLDEAAAVLDAYPDQNNGTLLSLRGTIAFYLKNYEEAIAFYNRAEPVSKDPEMVKRLHDARTANALDTAGRHLVQKEYVLAEALLKELYKSGSDRYSSGLMLGKTFITQRKWREAAALYQELEQHYPKEPDLTALRVESNIMAREYREVAAILREAPPEVHEYLELEREDLLYRVSDNWLKVSGGLYGQSGNNSTTETDLFLTVSQRVNQNTVTAWVGSMTKYSLTDTQIGFGVAGGKGEKSPFSWDVNFSVSPGALILPRTTAGIELNRGFSGFEASIGFTRMDFKESSANIVVPGLLWYIPSTTITLSERFYFVSESGGYSLLTTLHYELNHRFRCFASIGAGTSAEHISASEDYLRSQTISGRIGAEYRYTQHYSIGGEATFENRRNLYDRTGVILYLRYWWL